MKAIVKTNLGKKSFQLQNLPEPKLLQPGDVKLKMLYSGICGTDLHIYNGDQFAKKHIKTPHINGHEGVGQIIAMENSASKFQIGDYVALETHIFCNKCSVCQKGNYHVCKNMEILGVTKNGVWSEFVVLPEKILFKLDKNIPLKYGLLLESLGNAYHTQSYSQLTNKNVLITGDGPIGLFAGLIAKTKNPKNLFITGITAKRQKVAENCGLIYLNPYKIDLTKSLKTLTKDEGIDVVLETTGNQQVLKKVGEIINPSGEINVISLYKKELITLPINLMVLKNLRLQLVTGRKIWSSWKDAYSLIKNNQIKSYALDAIISDIIPFQKFEQGFAKIIQGKACKVLLSFNHKK